MPITYEYAPGSESDGVIVDVPVAALDRIDPAVFEWHVPGHREELVAALIRSLPKPVRGRFHPVADTARLVLEAPASGGLIDHLRRELSRISGESILASDFDTDRLPPHLRPVFRIIGVDGQVMAAGGDLAALRSVIREDARRVASDLAHPLERSGMVSWDVDTLPRTVTIVGSDHRVTGFPALVDEADSVSIRVLATAAEQADLMWFGTRRLLALAVSGARTVLEPLLTRQARLDLRLGPYTSTGDWVADVLDCTVDGLLAEAGGPAWDRRGFAALSRFVRDTVGERLELVGEASLGVLAALRDLQIAVDRSTAPLFGHAVDDIRNQVVRLVYPGFLGAVGPDRVGDVSRYLRAMEWRLDRLADDPSRDRDRQEAIDRLEAQHERLMSSIPVTPKLIEIGWQLQELRVSLFAQALGTRETVSVKRISAALREAELAI